MVRRALAFSASSSGRPTASKSWLSSPGVRSRHAPAGMPWSISGPSRTRRSLRTSIPTASIMFRTT